VTLAKYFSHPSFSSVHLVFFHPHT
jgi:hypothetical protein